MMNSNKPNLIFWGTTELGLPPLIELQKAGYPISAVISTPDAIAGRGQKNQLPSPISQYAIQHQLPLLRPDKLKNNQTFLTELSNLHPEVAILVAYGKIIPQAIIDLFPKGIINFHPSLLPKYRGPSPIQSAILNGETKTGISLMLLDAEMDHGPILAQKEVIIEPTDTTISLTQKLSAQATNLLIEILPNYLNGQLIPQIQDHSQATASKMINKEDGQINWTKAATQIINQIRAFTPWPGTWTIISNKRLKILKAHKASDQETGLQFTCADGNLIADEVQLEGKKIMSGSEFLRGYHQLLKSNN